MAVAQALTDDLTYAWLLALVMPVCFFILWRTFRRVFLRNH